MKAVIGCLVGLVFVVGASAESVLEGRVRLASGEAVPQAQVQVFDMTDLQRGAVAQAMTDGRGYFALPSVGLPELVLPKRFELGANYPNPFNPSTLIPYQLAASSYVRLEVFNLLGQRIATLVEGERSAGVHTAVWDATAGSGQAVGAGVYLYRLTVGGAHQTGRMVLVDGQAGVLAVGSASVWSGASGGSGAAGEGAPVYGLVVSGEGLAPYVVADLGIQAGMAPVELVVEAHPAGKALGDDDTLFDLSDLFNTSVEEAPDLVVASVSASDTTLTTGQAFILNAKVRNQGDEPSSATTLRYYRSTDATITSDDEEVGTDAIVALNPSAINGVLISLTAPASAGTYYYGACVESVNGESDTDNNCSSAVRITVSEQETPEEKEETPEEGEKETPEEDAELGEVRTFSLPGGGEMEFVWIEAGTFQMGSPESDSRGEAWERPVHEVEISEGFWLGKYEVTQGQWAVVMGTTPWSGEWGVVENPSHPAVYISWHDVQAFIGRLNAAAGDSLYRLPSEAEWEYACRAGTTTRWSFGDDASDGSGVRDYAWSKGNAWSSGKYYAHAVGLKRPNGWGLYDMHGNVYEWVQDWWDLDYYKRSPRVDPPGPTSGSDRVRRGGSVGDGVQRMRSADRLGDPPDFRSPVIGVRLVMSAGTYYYGACVESVNGESDTDNNCSSAVRITVSEQETPEEKEETPEEGEKETPEEDAELGEVRTFSLPGGGEMEFVWIEAGTFQMGSPESDSRGEAWERPVHEVEISEGFWLGKYEVTQGQWAVVMGTTPWSGEWGVVENPSHPAVYISWHDVQVFIGRLNAAAGDSLYRLPSEAEWEYACRAGTGTRWSFGDDASDGSGVRDYAWYRVNTSYEGKYYAHAVGMKLPNGWGLYDMHGNVYEWVQDWWDLDYYKRSPRVDPPGPTSGSYRVLRGGGVGDGVQRMRSADRLRGDPPDFRAHYIGVRLVRIR